jgi:hypothetical protein
MESKKLALASATIEQLKCAAYDTLALIEQSQSQLRAINNEIGRRISQLPPSAVTDIDMKEKE